MLVSIQDAAYFLHHNHAVVDELWARRTESFSEADLVAIVRACPTTASVPHVVERLKHLRIVEEALGERDVWQLSPPFLRWLEHLAQIARLHSSGEISVRVDFVQARTAAFDAALAAKDWTDGQEALREIRDTLLQIAEDCTQTRRAIANEVSRVKAEHRTQSPKKRFQRINRLWEEYLLPMLNLIDSSGPLEVACDRIGRLLSRAIDEGFVPDPVIADRIERTVQSLRVVLRRSFRECRAEIEPLHANLRRDSLWAEGATRLLAAVEQVGLAEALPPSLLPLSRFRFGGNAPRAALEAAAADWEVVSAPPPVVDFGATVPDAEVQAAFEIVTAVDALPRSSFPIRDLLPWLAEKHAAKGFEPIIQSFSLLVTDQRFIARFDQPITDHHVAGGVIRCGRVQLELAPPK